MAEKKITMSDEFISDNFRDLFPMFGISHHNQELTIRAFKEIISIHNRNEKSRNFIKYLVRVFTGNNTKLVACAGHDCITGLRLTKFMETFNPSESGFTVNGTNKCLSPDTLEALKSFKRLFLMTNQNVINTVKDKATRKRGITLLEYVKEAKIVLEWK